MGLSSPLIKPQHGESHSKCLMGASDQLGAAFRLYRARAVAASPASTHPPTHPSFHSSTHPSIHPHIHPSILPSIHLPTGETLLVHWAGNFLKKTSFLSPWDELQLDDMSAPVGAHKQGTWGEARPPHSVLCCARCPCAMSL